MLAAAIPSRAAAASGREKDECGRYGCSELDSALFSFALLNESDLPGQHDQGQTCCVVGMSQRKFVPDLEWMEGGGCMTDQVIEGRIAYPFGEKRSCRPPEQADGGERDAESTDHLLQARPQILGTCWVGIQYLNDERNDR